MYLVQHLPQLLQAFPGQRPHMIAIVWGPCPASHHIALLTMVRCKAANTRPQPTPSTHED